MNCEEITELLPAYALGALEPEEVEAVEAHLRGCREHDEELVELRATVFALDRYSDDVAEEAGATGPPAPAPVRGPRGATERGGGGWLAGLPAGGRWAVAAAAAVVLLFAAGWVAGQLIAGGGETVVYAIQTDDGAFMEVAGETDSDSVTVTMAGLQRLEGNSYQVWAFRNGEWVSIGVCNTNAEGRWVGDFDFSIEPDEQVALTIEPRGGSESPTSEPLLSTLR